MTLANIVSVKALIGSPSDQEDDDLDIEGEITMADRIVYDYTKKDDWLPTDKGYYLARDAAEKFAAARLLDKWGDNGDKATRMKEDFNNSMTLLRKTGYGATHDSDNPSFVTGKSGYKTAGNNPYIPRYFSRNAFGGEYDR